MPHTLLLKNNNPGLADRLRVTHYAGCPDFHTSDHKPVRAAFEIAPAPDLYTYVCCTCMCVSLCKRREWECQMSNVKQTRRRHLPVYVSCFCILHMFIHSFKPNRNREGLVIHEQPNEEEEEEGEEDDDDANAGASAPENALSLKELGGRHPRLVFYELSASGVYFLCDVCARACVFF